MKKVTVCIAVLFCLAVLALAAGPTIQAGAIFLNGTILRGSGGGDMTFQNATDTVVGRATTDTLTHKTFDTAGAGNVFKINTSPLTGVSGSGTSVLSNTASALTASPATADNSTKVATTAYVQNNLGGLAQVYAQPWAHTCAPTCGSFGASPQTAPTAITLAQADVNVANAEWTILWHGAVEHDGTVDSPSLAANLRVAGSTISSFICAGVSCNAGAVKGWQRCRFKILTTGAGGTAKYQCDVGVSGGSATGATSAANNTTDATIAVDTTGALTVDFQCTTSLDNERCHFYDALATKVH